MNHEDNPCPIDGWRRRVIDRDEMSVSWACPYCHGVWIERVDDVSMYVRSFVPRVWADKIKEAVYGTYPLPTAFQTEPLTDEEQAASEARRAARKAYLAELRDLLANTTDPVAHSVAVLHQPDKYGQCDGCDFGGWEAESPDWPCRTATLLGDLLGLEEQS